MTRVCSIHGEFRIQCPVCYATTRPPSCTCEFHCSALDLAKQFHTTYERLAPSYGYETRRETRKFDPDSANGRLVVAVCQEIIQRQRSS